MDTFGPTNRKEMTDGVCLKYLATSIIIQEMLVNILVQLLFYN